MVRVAQVGGRACRSAGLAITFRRSVCICSCDGPVVRLLLFLAGPRCTMTKYCVDGSLGALGAVLDEVGVGAQGEAGVGVTEVLTEGLDRFTFMERCAGVEVPESVAAVLACVDFH